MLRNLKHVVYHSVNKQLYYYFIIFVYSSVYFSQLQE